MKMLKFIFYLIITFIIALLISNGLRAAKEIEDEEEKHGALVAQTMLFIVWILSAFLYFS